MNKVNNKFIQKYLEVYKETQGILPEKLKGYRDKYEQQGHLTRKQLYEIAFESSTRSAHYVKNNKKEYCIEVTENLSRIKGDYSKIALIESLKGFKAPTASCILTIIDPRKHAIVDTRVWAALERKNYVNGRKETFNAEDYVEMIKHIRKISKKTKYAPEKIGYALFAYDYEVREGTLH